MDLLFNLLKSLFLWFFDITLEDLYLEIHSLTWGGEIFLVFQSAALCPGVLR